MGRIVAAIKWERAQRCAPSNHLISSDFAKYNPQQWKFLEGEPRVEWLLSYEYQRKWVEEKNQWKRNMYPEITQTSIDVVKHYVLTFNTKHKPPKVEEKKPFKMKRFEGIGSKTDHRRLPDDKAMAFEKEIKTKKVKKSPKKMEKPPKKEAK